MTRVTGMIGVTRMVGMTYMTRINRMTSITGMTRITWMTMTVDRGDQCSPYQAVTGKIYHLKQHFLLPATTSGFTKIK